MSHPQTHFDFDKIAGRYDRCNHLFSLGIDHLWRKKVVKTLSPAADDRVLDLCCGTGDVVFSFLRHSPVKTLTGADISEPMIHLAQEKQMLSGSRKWMQNSRIQWRVEDASDSGLEDSRFNFVTCAFGIRNIPDPAAALAQMYRVLTVSGKVGILEFSLPVNPVLRSLYFFYLKFIMPAAGRLVLGRRQPLQYLAQSIQQWEQLDFAGMLEKAGFGDIQKIPLSGGIVTLWIAVKNK